jgi:hypothetical protein
MWSWSSDRGFRGRACRFVARILYQLIAGLARLAMRSGPAKYHEIIVLRHQLAVLARNADRPAVTDDDRSLLAAVAHALPRPARTRSAGDTGHTVTLAPASRRPPLDSPAAPTGQTGHHDRDPPTGDRDGHRQSDVGVSAHPRRTRRPRPSILLRPLSGRSSKRTVLNLHRGELERVSAFSGSGRL